MRAMTNNLNSCTLHLHRFQNHTNFNARLSAQSNSMSNGLCVVNIVWVVIQLHCEYIYVSVDEVKIT